LQPEIIALPKIHDERGNLSFIQYVQSIPFSIERVYWIYDVPGGEKRGGHAFKTNHELIVAISGSFEVETQDGQQNQLFQLNRSYYGLLIPAGYWREIKNFSTNSFCLVLASTTYNLDDYIRDFDAFLEFRRVT